MTPSPTLPGLRELAASGFYLRQLAALLRSMDDEQYVRHVDAVGGSIGGHSRHILEHYQCILAARASGALCFEDRKRDARLQSVRMAALEEIDALEAEVRAWDQAYEMDGVVEGVLPCLNAPLKAATTLSGDLADAVPVDSTFQREWTYVVLHTVHHLALVAVAARLMGLAVDPAFGRAPATLHFEGRPVDFRAL